MSWKYENIQLGVLGKCCEWKECEGEESSGSMIVLSVQT